MSSTEPISLAELHEFRKLRRQLASLAQELGTLSGGNPGEGLGDVKLATLERLLALVVVFLGRDLQPFEDPVELTKTSALGDAVVVLGQYRACLDEFRARRTLQRYGRWCWVVEISDPDGETRIEHVPVALPGEPS